MSRTKAKIGDKFNKLTIIGESKNKQYKWVCECECGKTKNACTNNLVTGKMKSCGCLSKPDLTGIRFSNGVVIGKSDLSRPRRERIWNVQCDCGKIYTASSNCLTHGHTKSCGCAKIGSRTKYKTKHVPGYYYNEIEDRASKFNHDMEISIYYIEQLLINQNFTCVLTGLPIYLEFNRLKRKLNTASLDRIDSNFGYIEGNVRWIHKHVNIMKNDLDDATLIEYCKLIVNNSKI